MSGSNTNDSDGQGNAGVPESLWKALFEWSMSHQSDGTDTQTASRALSASDREWLEEALAAGVVDLSKQLVEISSRLEEILPEDASEEDVAGKARLLDELLDLVESIDQAKDLSTVGGLGTLLRVIEGNEGRPGLQSRAVEVIAACAQNNPEVQASFFRDGVMPVVWGLLGSADAACRLKALLAVSCMLRGSSQVQAWWSAHDGVETVVGILAGAGGAGGEGGAGGRDERRIRRKCLQILEYVARRPTVEDRGALVSSSGKIEEALARLLSEGDGDAVADADAEAPGADHDVEKAALDLGAVLAEGGLFADVPERLVEALQLYLARMDVVMHKKEEDWETVEENVVIGKSILGTLGSYRPPATEPSAAGMQLMVNHV